MKQKFELVIAWLLLTIVSMAANIERQPMVLWASQAHGGELVVGSGGMTNVYLSPRDTNAVITWNLSTPITPGAWLLVLDLTSAGTVGKSARICFDDPATAALDCGEMLLGPGSSMAGQSVVYTNGLILSGAAHSMVIRRSGQFHLELFHIRKISFVPVIPEMCSPYCSLVEFSCSNGSASAYSLGPGIFRLCDSMVPVVPIHWVLNDGTIVPVPAALRWSSAWAHCPVDQIEIGMATNAVGLYEYYPSNPPPTDLEASQQPLIVAEDETRREQGTLTLIPNTGGAPVMTKLPLGKTVAVVTSWDDGPLADLHIARMLKKGGMCGTFFVNAHSPVLSRLSALTAMGMEIGSHSWSHPSFSRSSPQRCLDESLEMRRLLEKCLKTPVISFAYPFDYEAAYDEKGDFVLRAVREAGYWSARTTKTGLNQLAADGFSMAEPLILRTDGHFSLGVEVFGKCFDKAMKSEGTLVYFWGHSWELGNGGEEKLAAIIARLGNNSRVWYATQGQYFTWQRIRSATRISAGVTSGTYTINWPWFHPALRTIPLSVRVGEGVTSALWNGKKVLVHDG